MTEQERIIGDHTKVTSILKDWLQSVDLPAMPNRKIRSLNEVPAYRNQLIDECAAWVVVRHIGEKTLAVLEEKRSSMSPVVFANFLSAKHFLPNSSKTQKGNLGEILLYQYLEEVTGYTAYVRKLAYNANVEQSVKGDDVLLFNPQEIRKDVIYGESKVRKTPSKTVVKDVVNNLQGNHRLPVSINFVIQVLRDRDEDELANTIEDMEVELANGNVQVRNVGMLLSRRGNTQTTDTLRTVVAHLNSTNPNLAFLAVGIDDVDQFVNDVYAKANNILLTGRV